MTDQQTRDLVEDTAARIEHERLDMANTMARALIAGQTYLGHEPNKVETVDAGVVVHLNRDAGLWLFIRPTWTTYTLALALWSLLDDGDDSALNLLTEVKYAIAEEWGTELALRNGQTFRLVVVGLDQGGMEDHTGNICTLTEILSDEPIGLYGVDYWWDAEFVPDGVDCHSSEMSWRIRVIEVTNQTDDELAAETIQA